MWFSIKFVKVTWRKNLHVVRLNSRVLLPEAELYKERFSTNQKFLPLPVQKLWPIICFHKSDDLDLACSSDFQKKKFCIVACPEDIFWNKN